MVTVVLQSCKKYDDDNGDFCKKCDDNDDDGDSDDDDDNDHEPLMKPGGTVLPLPMHLPPTLLHLPDVNHGGDIKTI